MPNRLYKQINFTDTISVANLNCCTKFYRMEPAFQKRLSLEGYNQMEEQTGTRYEYHSGEIYAMAGGSPKHGIIAGNTIGLLQNHLKKGCRIGSSDLKFYIASIDKSLYPDASVICQPYQVSS